MMTCNNDNQNNINNNTGRYNADANRRDYDKQTWNSGKQKEKNTLITVFENIHYKNSDGDIDVYY